MTLPLVIGHVRQKKTPPLVVSDGVSPLPLYLIRKRLRTLSQ